MDWLVERINTTWDEREHIQPNFEATREPGLLEVHRLLPGGNCRQCGEPTCLAFAAKLVRGETTTDVCVPMSADQHARKRDDLTALLGLG